MKFPDFIVIGAMKAGTTSLYEYLKRHPDIFMATPKELDYFMTSINYNKGGDWYQNHFQTNKIAGEVSPNYSKYEKTAGLIYEKIPTCKFIYIVRDPVKRIVSQMNHMEIDFREILDTTKWDYLDYIQPSKYYTQIARYLKLFKRSQFHFLTIESLQEDPLSEMNRIFDFISVRKMDDLNLFKKVYHQTSKKKSFTKVGKQISKKANHIKTVIPDNFYIKIKENIFLQRIFFRKKAINNIDEATKEKLYAYLKEDINKFLKVTGLKVNWEKFK